MRNATNTVTSGKNKNKLIMKRGLGVLACAALLFAAACGGGGGSSSSSNTTTTTPTGSNVQAITVSAGPTGNYANGVFTSVTVCAPNTSTCQTIDGVLVDTGSSGLRVLSSALTISLPQQNASAGNPVYECLPFVIGYTWGPVQTADIEMAGEKASSVPIQVINGSAPASSPCYNNPGGNSDTLDTLGANGIVGVGTFPEDCGGSCTATGSSNPDWYYECPTPGSCVVVAESLANQVQNPVALFSTDNNGVIIELPSVSAPEVSVSGSLVFGIGTQSNNGLNGATVYPIAPTGPNTGNFTTTFNGTVYDQSFIDSGSNAFFFPSSIPQCSDRNDDFYCPASTQNLSATNAGYAGTPTGTVTFKVANADDLFSNNPNAFVFSQLAGPSTIDSFDWGLPFFYGRNVYTAIYGASTPGGNGPYWAY